MGREGTCCVGALYYFVNEIYLLRVSEVNGSKQASKQSHTSQKDGKSVGTPVVVVPSASETNRINHV